MDLFFTDVSELLLNESSEEDFIDTSDSSDSCEEEITLFGRTELEAHSTRATSFYDVVNNYSLDDFSSHFRLSRSSVQLLLEDIKADYVICAGRPNASLKNSLLLTIWALSNQESFQQIGDRFKVGKGNAHRIFVQICRLITAQQKKYVLWPHGTSAKRTVQEFNTLRGPHSFPGVFGCVDVTHIQIPGLGLDPLSDDSYYNRNGYHSIILQGICDARQKFINIYCGWPGSASNTSVWENCAVNKRLNEDPEQLLLPNTYLLGSSAYPLKSFLMVPFEDNGNLTMAQEIFNCKLSTTRVVIEQAFRRLKGQFRRLKFLDIVKLDNAKFIITAACILHNIGIEDGVHFQELVEENSSETIESRDDLVNEEMDRGARLLRNQLMNKLLT